MARRLSLTMAALITAAALAVGAALSWLLLTRSGLEWAVSLAARQVPATVVVEGVSGRLAGPLELTAIRVRTGDATVRIGHMRLDWRPTALFWGVLSVAHFEADDIDIEPAQPPAETAAEAEDSTTEPPGAWRLPVEVRLHRLQLQRLHLRRAEGRDVRVDEVTLALFVDADRARLARLHVRTPRGEVSGGATLAKQGPLSLDGRFRWRYRPPTDAFRDAAGSLELAGRIEVPQLRLHVTAPTEATASATVRPFAAGMPWEGQVVAAPFEARQWWRQAPAWQGEARLWLSGGEDHASVEGEIGLSGLEPNPGPIRARVHAHLSPTQLRLQRVEIRQEQRPHARLAARGGVDLARSSPYLDITTNWDGLAWPLRGEAELISPEGRVRVSGTTAAYRLAGSGSLAPVVEGAELAELELSARGSSVGLDEWTLRAQWRGATARANGMLRWAQPGRLRATLALDEVNPARWSDAVLAGALRARLRAEAQWSEALSGRFELAELSGQVGGQPVSGSGDVAFEQARLRVDDLTLRAGGSELGVRGVVGDAVDLAWRVSVPSLAELSRRYQGRIRGRGAITGAVAQPRVGIDASAEALAGPSWALERLELAGHVSLAGGTKSDLRLTASELQSDQLAIERLEAGLIGLPERHTLTLLVAQEHARLRARLSGRLSGDLSGDPADWNWYGRLADGGVELARGGTWRQSEPHSVRWHGGRGSIDRGCWVQEEASLCGGGSIAPDGRWLVSLDADAVPTETLGRLWRADLGYAGRLALTGHMTGRGGQVTGSARVTGTPGRVTGTVEGEPTTLLAYEESRVTLVLGAAELSANARIPLVDGGGIEGRVRLGRADPYALEGRMTAGVDALGLIPVLVPQIGEVNGRLDADVRLDGSLQQPRIQGDVALASGSLTLVPLGIRLGDLEGQLTSTQAGIELRLRASSDGGRAEATTFIDRLSAETPRASGTIQGKSFNVVDLPQVYARASPSLDWRVDGRRIEVAGRVGVPSAWINPRDLSGALQVSPDTVVVRQSRGSGDEQGASELGDWRVHADVAVVPGDDVRIDAFGLKARLGGSLRVTERPDQATTATGELNVIEGTYTIYRQKLTIERGRLLFSGGPLANPGLDVRAVRRPRDVLVGVNVRGTLREPRVELFSQPPMAESQVLSYLIVGMPLGEAPGGQGETVAAAASVLLTTDEARKVAQRFGIDQIDVEQSDQARGASIVLGRYLSPRLYVGYGVGLLEEANSVRVRYELTETWSFEGRSGTTSSGDLLYSIEVDDSAQAVPEPLRGQGANGRNDTETERSLGR